MYSFPPSRTLGINLSALGVLANIMAYYVANKILIMADAKPFLLVFQVILNCIHDLLIFPLFESVGERPYVFC